ncbi:MAG: hypothetical protein ACI8RZ_004243 [Myxococcota bacterium]|jgi:hypothetical protein
MPIWISQDTVTADTPRNHSRTAWLTPLQGRIQAAIRTYVAANPGGEEVTLAVFNAIPPADVAKLLPPKRTIDAGRRELGLRIPLELIAMYGAWQVETYRRENGRTASPRRTNRDWPRNFTPHRVALTPLHAAQGTAFQEGFADTALWTDIFDAWLAVLSDYRAASGDLGWWHGPDACASQLIGAIWRLPGTVCIAPAPTPGDLWFSHDGTDCVLAIRAVSPADAASTGEAVSRTLDHAAWQLSTAPARRFVACFVTPALTNPDRPMSAAEAILSAAWEAAGPAGMARVLERDDLALTAKGGIVCPGVMLLVRGA